MYFRYINLEVLFLSKAGMVSVLGDKKTMELTLIIFNGGSMFSKVE